MAGSSPQTTSPLEPLEYVSLTDACYIRLKELILSRVFDWGAKLDVRSLANDLGVSRAPVIKAIERLAFEGLIDISPNRGSFVRQPTKAAVLEVAEARIAFELAALEFAFEKDAASLVENLQKNEEVLQDSINGAATITENAFIRYDTAFHSIIAEGSRNETLVKLSEILRNQIELFRRQSYANDLAYDSVKLHRAVIAATVSGDLPLAKATLRQHIEQVAQDYISSMEDEH